MKNINSSLFLVVALFTLLVATHSAQALTISPARIEIQGDPGATITKEITLSNDSKTAEQTFYVTYSNFEAQGETGSPLFVEPTSDLGTWMTSEKTVTLLPNESKKVAFTITVPMDAYSGGHFAAIFFGTSPAEGGQVSVGAKTGTLILLTVSGKVKEAGGLASFTTVGNQKVFNGLPVNMEYRWKNDGDDRVKPAGNVVIRNMFYMPVATIDANAVSGNILPRSTRMFSLVWAKDPTIKTEDISKDFLSQASYQWKNFAMGPYFAKLSLVYGANKLESSKTAMFFVLPWQLMLIILVILAIIILGGRAMLKSYKKSVLEQAHLSTEVPNDASHA